MIRKTELFTLEIDDVLKLIGAANDSTGSLILMQKGEEQAEVELNDLCLVVRIESSVDRLASPIRATIPMHR
jgi:hypothetical protein